jgi:hypothetical protein
MQKVRSNLQRVAVAFAALALANGTASAERLFRFEFNEGGGTTISNVEGTLTGNLPISFPETDPSSPSGGASDRSIRVTDPVGYLVMSGTNSPAFAAVDQPLTVEVWVKLPPDAIPRPEGIVGYGGQWKLGLLPSGNVGFTLYGVVDIDSGILPPLDEWFHIAASWDPGVGVTFFYNGVAASYVEETRAMRAAVHSWLGLGSGGNAEPLNGSVDRVRVHRALLTEDQLDANPATPRAPLASTLASFTLNEATGPYANAGTAGGSAVAALDAFPAPASPQFVADSPSGQAGDYSLFFDGNDRIEVPDPNLVVNLPGDFTIQAWVKVGPLAARNILFANNAPGGAMTFSISPARQVFVTTLGIADIPSAAIIPDDNGWHHIAVVHRQGQDLRFYVDGILGDTIPYTQGLIYTRTDTVFRIGAEGSGLYFNGYMDRLQLDDTALEADELDYLKIPGVDPGIPELSIGTAVALSWPSASTGFVLESTTDVTPPQTWTRVNTSPVVVDDQYYVLLPTPEAKTFYRLVRPVSESESE